MITAMTTPRPVRYRCELPTQLSLDEDGGLVTARLLELSETGAFVEDTRGLDDVQVGEGAQLQLALPGGTEWTAHVRFSRIGRGRVDVRTRAADHVSVSVRGFGVEFDEIDDDALEQLRDFLELLDSR